MRHTDPSSWTLSASQGFCERLARTHAGNFYPAFRLLPRPQRLAMCALYAFMRVADDLSDEPGPVATKAAALQAWQIGLQEALQGSYSHPLHPALAQTVHDYKIPPQYLYEVIEGVRMDLHIVRYATFSDLYGYCYRVASAVGLACIHVWGFDGSEALKHAEEAGIAFQMTNILRDIAEDIQRGRIYLPQEDLQQFGCTESMLKGKELDERFRSLMRFEAERARGYYHSCQPLEAMLHPPGSAVFRMMTSTYRSLLEEIVRRDYNVFGERIRLSKWRKVWLALQALPLRWG